MEFQGLIGVQSLSFEMSDWHRSFHESQILHLWDIKYYLEQQRSSICEIIIQGLAQDNILPRFKSWINHLLNPLFKH